MIDIPRFYSLLILSKCLLELYHDLFAGLVAPLSHSPDVVLDGLGEAGASGQPASDLGPRLSAQLQLEATWPPSSKLCQI